MEVRNRDILVGMVTRYSGAKKFSFYMSVQACPESDSMGYQSFFPGLE